MRHYSTTMARPEIGDRIATRLPPDLLERVDAAAASEGTSRAEWLRQAARDALSVQAPRYTEGRRRSSTELARLIAHHSQWHWSEDDELLDETGQRVAHTIEDAAEAMQELGWFAPGGTGVIWSRLPEGHVRRARALAVVSRLDERGRHQHVNGSAVARS